MITLICVANETVESKITIGNEYEATEMESFDGITPVFYYVTCDTGDYLGIKADAFIKK